MSRSSRLLPALLATALAGSALLCTPALADEPAGPIRRFALVVGANDGGPDRVTLRYAQDDAQAFLDVLTELGGVRREDAVLLAEPDAEDFVRSVWELSQRVEAAPEARTEVIFYYSGHSDERGLLLRGDEVLYKDVRAGLDGVPADVRIAVVDSCASGALTRAKGGTLTQPFLLDESRVVTGHAYLTSASADESAQEADRLLGSFFTHSLVTGLRGAADTSGDGRVTLSEAYTFAYDETLRRTENTRFGPQHATRQMDLTGTGDLVITDLSAIEAGLVLDANLSGRLSVRDAQGRLVAEVTKPAGRPMELGLGTGRYRVVLERDDGVWEGRISLSRGERVALDLADLDRVERVATVARGGDKAGREPELERLGLVAGLWPLRTRKASVAVALTAAGAHLGALRGTAITMGVNLVEGSATGPQISMGANVVGGDSTSSQFTMGANYTRGNQHGAQISIGGNVAGRDLKGTQLSVGLNLAGERVRGLQGTVGGNFAGRDVVGAQLSVGANVSIGAVEGVQIAVGPNIAGGPLRGVQLSAGLNIAPASSRGVQATSGVNIAGNDFHGVQVGIVNVGWDLTGSQVGIVNVAREVRGTQLGLVNVAKRQDGVSVGLVQLVKEGQLHGEVWASDTLPANVGVQFGGRRVFSQLHLGADPRGTGLLYTGFGMGVRLQRLAERPEPGQEPERDGRLWSEIDLSGGSLWQRDNGRENDFLGSLRWSVGFELGKHLSPELGAAWHVYGDLHTQHDTELRSLVFPDGLDPETRVATWPSVFAGVQF